MSKYQKYAEDDNYIYPHKHCPRCNAVMGEDKQYCSQECLTASTHKSKKSKKNTIIMVVVWSAVILVFILLIIFLKPPA